MGHYPGGDNRVRRLRRNKKQQARLKQLDNPKTTGVCVKCGIEATYTAPRPYCTEHWIKWWTSGLKAKTNQQFEVLVMQCRKNLSENPKNREQWVSICSAHQKIDVNCLRCRVGSWLATENVRDYEAIIGDVK